MDLWSLFFDFHLEGMDVGKKIVVTGIPEPVKEIIESIASGGIPRFKTIEDGIKRIYFKLRRPVSDG